MYVKLPIGWSMSPYGTSASTPQIVLHIIQTISQSICYKPSGNRSLDPISISRTQEEENVNFNYRSAFEYRSVKKSLNIEMRRVIRSNKSHGTSKRWNGKSRDRADPKLLLIGEREMQFMNTKFEKQMMHVKNFINLYLTSIASIWVIWIIWLLNLISH